MITHATRNADERKIAEVEALLRDRRMACGLDPETGRSVRVDLARPPASYLKALRLMDLDARQYISAAMAELQEHRSREGCHS